MRYLKNFLIDLFTIIGVWIILIHWFGFKVLLTIPVFWWGRLKNKLRRNENGN